jgi:two-component system heavy metal sensor histidine kinase CusS
MKELVDTFNELLGRVEDSFQSLRRFTADASHELRTPLALMRVEVDSVLAKAHTGKEYREALIKVREEVDRMTRLADQLLYLARADAGVLVPASTPVDIADLLYDTAGRWAKVAAVKHVKLEVLAPSSGTVPSDPDLLRRVFDNLVDNAIRHSPAGGRVALEAARSNGTWEMRVSDEGPGMPPELLNRIFTRFARSDDSRRNGAGAGLGLALSRAILEAHNGRLELDSTRKGASFRIVLPAIGC